MDVIGELLNFLIAELGAIVGPRLDLAAPTALAAAKPRLQLLKCRVISEPTRQIRRSEIAAMCAVPAAHEHEVLAGAVAELRDVEELQPREDAASSACRAIQLES